MAGLFDWLRKGRRPAVDDNGLGDFDPYVVHLVRERALLGARAAAPRLN
jgi:hypothetical protein